MFQKAYPCKICRPFKTCCCFQLVLTHCCNSKHGDTGLSSVLLATYKGCLGCPTAVRPKQCAFLSNGKTKLPTQPPCMPQAATVIAACCVAFAIKYMLSGPTGSCTSFSSLGHELRYPYKFTTVKLPKPHAFAKLIHRLIVGSSEAASAVLGFSIQKHTFGSASFQTRKSRYLYCCAESVTALDISHHV